MRKTILAALCLPLVAGAQPLLSTSPENRTVLVEQFTGIYAGEGKQGNDAANAVFTSDPLKVAIINYHTGAFAEPIGADPDFRTADGGTIGSYYSVQQYPRGVVNRRPYPNNYAINYSQYAGAANQAKNLPSPVNLGMISTYNSGTNSIDVTVELYYTADGTGGNDYLTVAIVESDVVAIQYDFVNGNDSAYAHPYIFRTMLAGTWGEVLSDQTAGHSETKNYSITVDPAWDVANCRVVAFVGELQDDVYQARSVTADGGSTTLSVQENGIDRQLGYAFPVPANETVTIPFYELTENVVVRITDATGRLVEERTVAAGTQREDFSVNGWRSGIYSYQMISTSGSVSTARQFQVL